MEKVDVAVIGSGPGGYVAAIRAAQLGGTVALVEMSHLGGCCLNSGCIPTKSLRRSIEVIDLIRRAREFGLDPLKPSFEFAKIMERKDRIVSQLRKSLELLFKQKGVQLFLGKGSLVSKNRVHVEGEQEVDIEAKSIIVATGSLPWAPPIPGSDLPGVINTDGALTLTQRPGELIVVGGGAVGLELACIYHYLGTRVTILEMLDRLTPTTDHEIGDYLASVLKRKGIGVQTRARVDKIEESSGRKAVTFTQDGEQKRIEGDAVLLAVGRKPYTEGLGIESLGVSTQKGNIVVTERMETSASNVYAIGDVTGGFLLAHVASAQGKVAAANCMGGSAAMDYTAVPGCVCAIPEVATVGVSEEQAIEKGIEVKLGRFPIRATGKALAEGEREGLAKIVSDAKTGAVIGVHLIGPHASDLIAEGVLAVRHKMTAHDVAEAIHAHPTFSEPVGEAADDVLGLCVHI